MNFGPFTKVYKLFWEEIGKIYSHLPRFTSTLQPISGVTSGKNQLISGSGVSIYQGFTQETSQLLKKYKNQSHLQPISASCGALPLPVSRPIYTNRQNLALPTENSPNFEKIDSGRRPLAIFSKFGLKNLLTTFANFWPAKTHNIKTSPTHFWTFSKSWLLFFRRHF